MNCEAAAVVSGSKGRGGQAVGGRVAVPLPACDLPRDVRHRRWLEAGRRLRRSARSARGPDMRKAWRGFAAVHFRSSASSVPARLGQNRRESRLVGESLRIATVGGNGSRTVVAARHRAEIAGGRCRRARNRRRRSTPCPGCGRGAGPLEHRLPIVGRVAAAGRRKRSCPIRPMSVGFQRTPVSNMPDLPDTRLIERWLPIAALGIESVRERTPIARTWR